MPVTARPPTKRLPLSSKSSTHNHGLSTPATSASRHAPPSSSALPKPSTASSPVKKRVVRPVKSNPTLRLPPSTDLPPPLPNSPTFPVTQEVIGDDNTAFAGILAPPKVVFAPEIFVHRHTREFPHLHDTLSVHAVPRRTSPAGSIESQQALAALPLPPTSDFLPLSPPMSPPEPAFLGPVNGQRPSPEKRTKRAARPLSLVALQPLGGLFGPGVPLPTEVGAVHQEELISEQPMSGARTSLGDKGPDESRDSSEMSSECNLSFSWEQSIPRVRSSAQPVDLRPSQVAESHHHLATLGPVLATIQHESAHQRKSSYTPSEVMSTFSTLPPAPVFSLPPTPVTPSTSTESSTVPSTNHFAPPVPSLPASVANYSRPRPAHARGPSVTYRLTPSPIYDPTTLPEHQSPPRPVAQLLPELPTSLSAASMTSSEACRDAWSNPSPNPDQDLFWRPPASGLEQLFETEEPPSWRSTMSGAEELNRLEIEAAAGLLTKSRSDGGLVQEMGGSVGGSGIRERYLRDGGQTINLSRPPLAVESRPNTPDSNTGFVYNPTPPVYLHSSSSTPSLVAPSSMTATRSSWTNWFGTSSTRRSRRVSDQHHTSIDATKMENGEAHHWPQSAPYDGKSHEGRFGGGLRPTWTQRNGSLPLPSPSSGESSGSSFGNAPGEIWAPSPSGLGFEWPSSPHAISPSLVASPRLGSASNESIAVPPVAHTVRRPSAQDASFAPLHHSPTHSLSQVVLAPPPNAAPKGLKPLLLSAPPKQLRKTLRATLLPTIEGSPSKRALEEGRSQLETDDDIDEYYVHESPVNIAVYPATPMRHPAPLSPGVCKTTEIPTHQRTYSSAFSPSASASSVYLAPPSVTSYMPHSSQSHMRARSTGASQLATSSTETVARSPSPGFALATRPASRVSFYSMVEKVVTAPMNWMDNLLPAQVVFFLGFCLGPWTWILGGWGLSSEGLFILGNMQGGRRHNLRALQPSAKWGSTSPRFRSKPTPWGGWRSSIAADLKTSVATNDSQMRKAWILPALRRDNPNRWVWRCRVAAIISGLVVIPGLILAVIFAIL